MNTNGEACNDENDQSKKLTGSDDGGLANYCEEMFGDTDELSGLEKIMMHKYL